MEDLNFRDKDDRSPFVLACSNNNIHLVKYLFDRGDVILEYSYKILDKLYRKKNKFTDFLFSSDIINHIHIPNNIFKKILFNADELAYDRLIKLGHRLTLKHCHPESFETLIRCNKYRIVNDILKLGYFPRCLAMMSVMCNIYSSHHDKIKMIDLLIKHGFDVNEHNMFGETALQYAIHDESKEMVEYLIQKGAVCDDPLEKAARNFELFQLVSKFFKATQPEKYLRIAIFKNDYDMIEFLFNQYSYMNPYKEVCLSDNYVLEHKVISPFREVCYAQNIDRVQYLLRKKTPMQVDLDKLDLYKLDHHIAEILIDTRLIDLSKFPHHGPSRKQNRQMAFLSACANGRIDDVITILKKKSKKY